MPDIVNVSWPGQHIAEDTTHRLVTDAQIERWNKINNISGDDQYIELTPENISQYTCTKPDEYWTDMGLADGTIFDSSSLDEGNYIIKLGMDKLQKMPSVSSPNFRFGKDGYTMYDYIKMQREYNNGNMTEEEFEAYTKALYESLGYQTYVNYTIETQTFLFLCMFFGQELSLTDLLTYIRKTYCGDIILQTSLTNCEYGYNKIIKWPEAIRIKITKEQYGPENNMYVLKRNIFFDMNIVDYFNCYNYKWNGDKSSDVPEPQSLTDEDYGIATLAVDPEGNGSSYKDSTWIECDFTGVPVTQIIKSKSSVPFYTTTLSSKTSREYITQSRDAISSTDYGNIKNTYELIDTLHVYDSKKINYGNYGRTDPVQTIINSDGILIFTDTYTHYNVVSYDSYGTKIPNFSMQYQKCISITDNYINCAEYDFSGNYGYSRIDSWEITLFNHYHTRQNGTKFLRINANAFDYQNVDDGNLRGGFRCYNGTFQIYSSFGDVDYCYASINDDGIDGKFFHPLKIKLNDTTTYTYNNTEDVTVDLSELGTKNTKVTNWDTALTPGHYYSDLDATNAPYNTLSGQLQGPVVFTKKETFGFCGTVERIGDNLVIQHLYSGTNCDMNQYIRKGVSTSSDASIFEEDVDKDGWIFGEWYCVEFSTGSSEACAPFGFKGVPA